MHTCGNKRTKPTHFYFVCGIFRDKKSPKMAKNGGSGEPNMHEINMQRESWCTVEMNSRQDWCRAERKHDKNTFNSSVFSETQSQPDSDSRCTFEVNDKTHKERRHFPNKSYYSHLAI